MRVIPCPSCARHVRQHAGVCPFCDSAMPAPTSTRAMVGAMLVGAAAVSTLTGCPRAATKYGGPPVPYEDRQPSVAEPESTPELEPEPESTPEPAPEPEAPEVEGPEASH